MEKKNWARCGKPHRMPHYHPGTELCLKTKNLNSKSMGLPHEKLSLGYVQKLTTEKESESVFPDRAQPEQAWYAPHATWLCGPPYAGCKDSSL